jgi:GlpG protein
MIKIARVPVESDLSSFSSWLNSQGLAHRITEELGEQAIFLENEGQEQQVNDALQLYLTDEAFK